MKRHPKRMLMAGIAVVLVLTGIVVTERSVKAQAPGQTNLLFNFVTNQGGFDTLAGRFPAPVTRCIPRAIVTPGWKNCRKRACVVAYGCLRSLGGWRITTQHQRRTENDSTQ